ncbi:p24 family protein delta-1 [Pancytospora epiphaga]|nr:p24 family protein delta-1 [Pancytospora epiphaga]
MLCFSLGLLLLEVIRGEIFQFKAPNENLKLNFNLDENNVNTGFFSADTESNLTYKVEVRSKDLKRILYKIDTITPGVDTHFSFSNSDAQEVFLLVSSLPVNASGSFGTGMFRMKFESGLDTFNKDVSKKSQIEPAMYALEHLLKKLNDIVALSRAVSTSIGSLGHENRKTLKFVLISSFLTLGAYLALNILQLYYMRSYLNEKKYL